MPPKKPYLWTVAVAIVVFVSILLLLRQPNLALCLGCVSGGLAWGFFRERASGASAQNEAEAAQIAELLAAQLASGLTLTEAIQRASLQAPESMRNKLQRLEAIFDSDRDAETLIDEAKSVLDCRTGDSLFEALLIALKLGDSRLLAALEALSKSTRRELGLVTELRARQQWILGTAKLGQIAPWIVVVMLSLRPETGSAYSSSQGLSVLLGGLALSLVAQRFLTAGSVLPQAKRIWLAAK